MDNVTLEPLLEAGTGIHFWLKPLGNPDLAPDEEQVFTSETLRIDFARRPFSVSIGDALIAYRILIKKVIFVAECASEPLLATPDEIEREPWRQRWPWYIQARNLTPDFGRVWSRHALDPFELVGEYNHLYSEVSQNLKGIMFGADKLRISVGLGQYVVRQILALA
jgi:hypothetical protein